MTGTCAALTTEHTQWNFCPNVGAAYAFAIFFGLTTIAHITQAIIYKKAYSWVIIVSGLAQTLTYIFRILSILHPDSFGAYVGWFVLILVAPLFTNAYVYMALGRMVWNYVADAKIYRITAWRLGMYFVILDVVALIIQVFGAASASGNDLTQDEVLKGLHIYMAGVGIQQFFIFVFVLFAIKLHRTILSQSALNISNNSAKSPFPLLYTIYAVLLLITIRIIFRLVEYSEGLTSKIPSHEAYQYALDSLPMLVALVLLNVVHPGQVMQGKECDIPGRKQRKAMGNEKSAMQLSENLSSGLP
ncbi:RTA1 like protein-domain-containing protein [Halenospora varia]|nr:RTA1 like protein-domain-containing protein [Halenospora varia]